MLSFKGRILKNFEVFHLNLKHIQRSETAISEDWKIKSNKSHAQKTFFCIADIEPNK